MDGQRFDEMTREMAGGATRRQALRLAEGGLAGALLAAVGLGKRAGAQKVPPACGDLEARCVESAGGACEGLEAGSLPYFNCLAEHGGEACRAFFTVCTEGCDFPSNNGLVCQALEPGGETSVSGCPQGKFCATAVNAGNQIVCRCVSLD